MGLAAAAFEELLAPGDDVERIGRHGLFEDHEVGRSDVRLARQRHEEVRIVVRRGRDVHVHHPLTARDAGIARGEDTAVEVVVVAGRGIEHEHLLRGYGEVVGDVRQVAQVEVQIETAAVAQRVVDRHVRCAEAVALDTEFGRRHRIDDLRVIDLRAQAVYADTSREVGLPALPLQHQLGCGRAFGRGDHAREQRVEQPHVEPPETQGGVVAARVGSEESAHERIALHTVGDRDAGPAPGEVPARDEPHRRGRNVVGPDAVEEDVGRDLGPAKHRLHGCRTVHAPLDVVAHALGDLCEGGQVEVPQREGQRVVAAARGDTVEQQLLLVVHHEEAVDGYTRRIDADAARVDLPGFAATRDVRRQNTQSDGRAVEAVGLCRADPDADQPRRLVRRIDEAGGELDAALLRSARHREVRQVEHPGIEVLGRGVEHERVVAARGVHAQPRGQHAAPLDILRRNLQRQLVARRVEQQPQRRAVGDLQPGGNGVGDGIDVADIDREQREVVGHGRASARQLRGRPGIVQPGHAAQGGPAQVFEDGAVAGFRAEGGVGKVRTQFDEFAVGRVLARDRDVRRRDLPVVVAVECVGHLDAAVQVVERAAAGLGDDARRKLRDRIAAVDAQAGQVGTVEVERKVVTRHRVVQIDQSEKVEVQVGVAGRDTAVELAVAQASVEADRVVGIAVEVQPHDIALNPCVGKAATDLPVDTRPEGRIAQQVTAPEQIAQAQVLRRDLSLQAAAARTPGFEPHAAGDVAHVGRGAQLHVERREQSPEPKVHSHPAGMLQHTAHLPGQGLAGNAAGQIVGSRGRRAQVGDRKVEMRAADIGQPAQRGRGREGRAVADAHAADPGGEVRDDTRRLDIDLREGEVPVAQAGRKVGDVVGRDRRVAHGGVEAHLPDKIAVVGPRRAGQRDVRDADLRAVGQDRGVLETQTALRQVEAPGELLQAKAAPLAGRKGGNGGIDGLPVDGEVIDPGVQAVQMHVREVDAVFAFAPLAAVEAQLHVLDLGLAEREAEVALALPVGIRQPADDLLDVHLPVVHLPQEELAADDPPAADLKPPAEEPEVRDVGLDPTGIKERVAPVVLDIETLDAELREEPDIDTVDAHGGPEPLGDQRHGLVHHEVLHGRNVEQQREHDGKNYQQQNEGR